MVITVWREKVAPEPVEINSESTYGDLLNALRPKVDTVERADTTARLLSDGSLITVGTGGLDITTVSDIYFFAPLSI